MNNEQIRDAVVSRIDSLLAINVFKSKFDPTFFANLPVVCVYVNNTTSVDNSTKAQTGSPLQYTYRVVKSAEIAVEIVVKAVSTWVTDADTYLEQIKSGLFEDQTFHDLFYNIAGYDEEYVAYTQGEQPITTCVLTINVETEETFRY